MLRHLHRRPSPTDVIHIATKAVALITHPRTLSSSANERLFSHSHSHRSFATMTGNDESLDAIFRQKHSLRSRMRKKLKNIDPTRRSEEDDGIQSIVLSSPWFNCSRSICGYISSPELREVDTSRIVAEVLSKSSNGEEGDVVMRRKLYLPQVEDRNSNMRMLRINSVDDLIVKSMNVLEPAVSDAEGKQYEDAMEAEDPVALFILPGLAFDSSGRRLGRSGGYYDMFLKKYQKACKRLEMEGSPLCCSIIFSTDRGGRSHTCHFAQCFCGCSCIPSWFCSNNPSCLDGMCLNGAVCIQLYGSMIFLYLVRGD